MIMTISGIIITIAPAVAAVSRHMVTCVAVVIVVGGGICVIIEPFQGERTARR